MVSHLTSMMQPMRDVRYPLWVDSITIVHQTYPYELYFCMDTVRDCQYRLRIHSTTLINRWSSMSTDGEYPHDVSSYVLQCIGHNKLDYTAYTSNSPALICSFGMALWYWLLLMNEINRKYHYLFRQQLSIGSKSKQRSTHI